MCNTVNFSKYNRMDRGFTIVEFAIVTVIIGIMMVPALQAYNLFRQHEAREDVRIVMATTRDAIGRFRALNGRYPCPARANAVVGDVDYGRESRAGGVCVAVANGVWQVNSANAVNPVVMANPEVFIGSLPFKDLNVQEDMAYDSYNNRLTYAVTGLQADSNTYENNNGGIDIVDLEDDTILGEEHSAHYIVLSHGRDGVGAITRGGNMLACPPIGDENENCDYAVVATEDAAFRVAQESDNFSVAAHYATSDSVEQWQYSDTDAQDVHLRRGDSFVLGATETDPTAGFAQVEIIENVPGDGVIRAESDGGATGSFMTTDLCDEADTNCFQPRVVGGDIAIGDGMECPPGEFLVAVANSAPVCRAEIWFSCPAGEFVAGFNASGEVICSGAPPVSCVAQNLTATCGASRNVTPFFSGGTWYGYAYDGTCHRIGALDTSATTGLASMTPTEAQAYIDTLNNTPRTADDCGPDEVDALTRDTFECVSGAWNPTPINTLERRFVGTDLSSFGPTYTGSGYVAENNGPVYDPTAPMSADPNNNNRRHDCWCREDYIYDERPCTGASTGVRWRILQHVCPQTEHNSRPRVYPSSGWDTSDCGCEADADVITPTCANHFGYTGPGITGNVTIPYTVSCPAGPTGAPVTTYGPADTTNCACPFNTSPILTTDPCPLSQVNSFNYTDSNGTVHSFTNVENVYEQDWVCPTGPAPQQPISSAADAGYYTGANLVHTEACSCDGSRTPITHTEPCATHPDYGPEYEGTGVHYSLAWDCATGSYEAPSAANETSRDCRRCVWQQGSFNGNSSTRNANLIGDACGTCGSPNQSCSAQTGALSTPTAFSLYSSCYCAAQP